MTTKYDFNISVETFNKNATRLTNQIWKLIPMRENDENWQKQLSSIIIEVAGLHEIFVQDPHFLQMLSKLEGLQIKLDIPFNEYRSAVFESISLLQECIKDGH